MLLVLWLNIILVIEIVAVILSFRHLFSHLIEKMRSIFRSNLYKIKNKILNIYNFYMNEKKITIWFKMILKCSRGLTLPYVTFHKNLSSFPKYFKICFTIKMTNEHFSSKKIQNQELIFKIKKLYLLNLIPYCLFS